MKRKLLFLYINIVGLLLCGCGHTKASSNSIEETGEQPLLLFQKTPCFGTCPAYNALLNENGSVQFVEYKNAIAQDTLQLQLLEEELQQLKEKIERLNYKSLQSSYLSQWSDNSTTYLTFYQAGKEVKRVKHEEGGPQQLIQFQEWLHALIWQKAEEMKRPTY